MRGTGKTTVARIFAASLLCKNLPTFQKDPTYLLPCYSCDSCLAFQTERHPDIYEIDAASHTGVDTIRSLIDNSYLLPVLATKKIYIIDEVHMLSKAAFNACLKVMEEPPAHVHFILATTDIQKVIETVRSRSVQLYFNSLTVDEITDHLMVICDEEDIKYKKNALVSIARSSQGSMRDAINILERVRLVYEIIDEDAIDTCLGLPSHELIESFIDAFIFERHQDAFHAITTAHKKSQHAQGLWELICMCVRNRLTAQNISTLTLENNRLVYLLRIMYKYESLYMNSSLPYGILELICYQGFQTIKEYNEINGVAQPQKIQAHASLNENFIKNDKEESLHTDEPVSLNQSSEKPIDAERNINNDGGDVCKKFVLALAEIDKAVASIMQQALLSFDNTTRLLLCTFDKRFLFYRDFIEDKKSIWNPLLQNFFGNEAILKISFNESDTTHHTSYNDDKSESISYQQNDFQKNTTKKTMTKYQVNNNKNTHEGGALAKEISTLFPGVTERVITNERS